MKLIRPVLLVLFPMLVSVQAHPGRLDANGGHTDRKTGIYHCHRKQTSSPSTPAASAVQSQATYSSPTVMPAQPAASQLDLPAPTMRTWTFVEDGKVQILSGGAVSFSNGGRIDAALVRNDSTNVVVRMVDGNRASFPLKVLSQRDRDYLTERGAARKELEASALAQAPAEAQAAAGAKEQGSSTTKATAEYAQRINTFAAKYDETAEEAIRWDYVMSSNGLLLSDLDSFFTNLGRSRDRALGYHPQIPKKNENTRRLVSGDGIPAQTTALSDAEQGIIKMLKLLKQDNSL